jgi:hypothetical protein
MMFVVNCLRTDAFFADSGEDTAAVGNRKEGPDIPGIFELLE